MKKIVFLAKLFEEGRLQLAEPSEEIKESYIKKSDSNLISAKILLENDKLEESVSLAYYGMYHMLTALLFKTGIKCENHSAAILLLEKLFGVDNAGISLAKKERIDKQYYVGFKITKHEVSETIRKAEHFNKQIFDVISKLNNQKIEDLRNKFNELVVQNNRGERI